MFIIEQQTDIGNHTKYGYVVCSMNRNSVRPSLKNRSVGTSQSRGLSPRDLEISNASK